METSLKKTINLEYKNADLANVLRSMAWTYQLNIVTSPNIKGSVSINLKDITVEAALEAILSINGLTYAKRGGVIYISPGNPEIVEMVTELITLKYMSASEAQNVLKELQSPKGGVKINETSNTLIVTDFQANIDKVKSLLAKMDSPPLQVLIEAKIVDITSNDLKAIGATYNFNYQPGAGLFTRKTGTSERLDTTYSMAEQSSSLSGGQFVLNNLTLKGLSITATLDALIRDGKANLMASPSIAVLNGQEARIVIGERFPYKERTQTTSGTTETTKFADIGTTLKVKPQINDDGYITINVHPEVSSLLESLDAGPRITTREADTTVRIREGETLIIGGLINQSDNRSRDKVPLAGDVPILGFLFSRSSVALEQKELAVFITPKILRSKEEIKKIAESSSAESRDEALRKAYVMADRTADLNVVESIMEKAIAMDEGYGLPSTRKTATMRKFQALGLYENIVSQFPDSERVPEALYRLGMIYLSHYRKYALAKDAFYRIFTEFPTSHYAGKARVAYAKAEKSQGRALPPSRKEDPPVQPKVVFVPTKTYAQSSSLLEIDNRKSRSRSSPRKTVDTTSGTKTNYIPKKK